MKSTICFFSAFSLCTAVLLLVYCAPQPIVITSPAAGAKLLAGDTILVQWAPSITAPKVSYNYNLASSSWQPFTTVIPVSSQEVKVALPTMWYSDSFQIKVEDGDGAHDAGVTRYLHEKFIFLTTALGGQTIHVGNSATLSWRACLSNISSVEVLLSTDSGKSYNEIIGAGSIPVGTALSCLWVVGSETGWDFVDSLYPSSGCVVKVRQYNHDEYMDLSGIFTVAKP